MQELINRLKKVSGYQNCEVKKYIRFGGHHHKERFSLLIEGKEVISDTEEEFKRLLGVFVAVLDKN